jgi:hypothetical protein
MQTAPDERSIMLRAAVAKCFRYGQPITPTNVRKHTLADFWINFDTGENLTEEEIFKEIQSTYSHAPKARPMIEDRPDHQGPLAPAPVEEYPNYLPPSEHIAEPVKPVEIQAESETEIGEGSVPTGTDPKPVTKIAAPVANDVSAVDHAANGPGLLSPQERLDRARSIEGNLIAARPALNNAIHAASADLNLRKQEYAAHDTNRQSADDVAREFRETSNRERAARVARTAPGRQAYVDLERKYSRGTDGDSFARRNNVTGNRRGSYSRAEAALSGFKNRDPSRGATPAPEPVARPTIPALAK